ncbi:MAG: glutamyl-tRNA reductase [Verrucomicrobia bacterium]|nr:glutamyl-tRNA reductase [Verrucomicrobiota bacterium]
MNILAVGLNHRTAPVEIRERFAIPAGDISALLDALIGNGIIREAVILSTCNRVEVYAVCPQAAEGIQMIFGALQKRSGLSSVEKSHFYIHEFPASVQHLYCVCSGLDSMVVGETEILGQVKEAYRLAHAARRTGPALNKLFQNAFGVAKATRSQTCVGMGSVSVGSVAADLAGQIFGDLSNRAILLIGAGETSETTARALQERGARSLVVANRSHDRAVALAGSLGGQAARWEEWPLQCEKVDIVISSTAAPNVVVTKCQLEEVMRHRNGAPLFMIDLAVPRDIERDAGGMEGVFLYDIDDLQVIADQNLATRQKEIAICQQIIRERADHYQTWFSANQARIAQCPTARELDKLLAQSAERKTGLAPA